MLSRNVYQRTKGTGAIFIFLFAILIAFSVSAKGELQTFTGYLFTKVENVGSKSEGPGYYLMLKDKTEMKIKKDAELWKEDPHLQKFVNTCIIIDGTMEEGMLNYEQILSCDLVEGDELTLMTDLRLGIEDNVLWIDKMPGFDPLKKQKMDLTLRVKWPYRSIWKGKCLTSQIYDFEIRKGKKVIWRWSDDKKFNKMITTVKIPGGEFIEYPVVWVFSPDDIKSEGSYTAWAIFIASEQEVLKDFEIKFAH